MKISNRLLMSNIIITLLCMMILSVLLSKFMTDFIKDEVKDDLWTETKIYSNLLKNRDILITDGNEYYFNPILDRKREKSDIIDLVIIEEESLKVASLPYQMDELFNKDIISELYDLPDKTLTEMKIGDKNFYVLVTNPEGLINGMFDYKFVSMVYDDAAESSILSMRLILLTALIFISLLSVFLTTYYDKKLTRPVETLLLATKRIAEKNFDEKVIVKSGDEFENLAVALNDMSGRLKELDVEQKHFYENVSHDIKTPLAVISGYAQNIQSGVVDNVDAVLDTVISECDRLKHTLENVIFLSKIDSMDDFIQLEKVDIHELIGRTLDHLQSLFVLNEIDIIFEPKESIILKGDPSKLEKVFNNIFTNCLKFTRSVILIEVTVNDSCVISIKDDGPGFPEDILNTPINRRGHSEQGSGIGLSIVESVVQAHQGSLKITNDQGAVYTIKLPHESLL